MDNEKSTRLSVHDIDLFLEYLYPRILTCEDTIVCTAPDEFAGRSINSISAILLVWNRIRYNIITGGGGKKVGKKEINCDEYGGWTNEHYLTEGKFQWSIILNIVDKYRDELKVNHTSEIPSRISRENFNRISNWGDSECPIEAQFETTDISNAMIRLFSEFISEESLAVRNNSRNNNGEKESGDNIMGYTPEELNRRNFSRAVNNLWLLAFKRQLSPL